MLTYGRPFVGMAGRIYCKRLVCDAIHQLSILIPLVCSPYRDAHGEVDLGLMRGKPLTLNENEYAQLTRQWLALSFHETSRSDEAGEG